MTVLYIQICFILSFVLICDEAPQICIQISQFIACLST